MKKRKAKKKSKYYTAYKKERARIQNFMRGAKKRGYYFEEGILPDIPKTITASSVNRLKKLTSEALYRRSFYLDAETGEVINGRRYREIEQSTRGKRAAATRKANRESARRFWEQAPGPDESIYQSSDPGEYVPDLLENVYERFYWDFIQKVSTPLSNEVMVQNLKKVGRTYRKRWQKNIEAANKAKSYILTFMGNLEKQYTKQQLGLIIYNNWDALEDCVNYILFGSDDVKISTAAQEALNIINGGLTQAQNIMITEESIQGELVDEL